MKFNYLLLIIALVLASCNDSKQSNESTTQSSKNQKPESESTANEVKNDTVSNSTDIDSINDQTESDKEEDDYPEFVYLDFDSDRVLQYLGLPNLIEERTIANLLTSDLANGLKVTDDILETGDGTFDIYKAFKDDVDVAYFYHTRGNITTIEILDSMGVPDDMISPGHSYGELSATYNNPVAYGSEIEARVFVNVGQIGFRMDASYGIYEPIDLDDDTEILYIQF